MPAHRSACFFLWPLLSWLGVGFCSAQITIHLGAELADSPIRPLLGVNAGPTPSGEPGNAELTSRYREIGVTLIRTHDYYGALDMPTLYPDQFADPAAAASYDFTHSDNVYRAILDGGFEPYLRIGDSYNNVRRISHLANWVQAAVQVVRHYQDPALWGRAPLRHAEIYNEPDSPHFWRGTRLEFFELFAQTAKALKQAFPGLKVGGPGFAPSGFLAPQGRSMSSGLVQYCRAQGIELDFLSFHVYTNNPADYAAAAAYYRNLLDANGYHATELHITEWNTENPGRADGDPHLRIGARGAALNTAAWIQLQDHKVAVSAFYRGNDTSPALPTFYGLFFADGRPKPAAEAFALWAKMSAYSRRVEASLTGAGQLHVLGGRKAAGELALLLANPASVATPWRVEGSSGPVGVITLHEISPDSNSVRRANLSSLAAEIPGHSVQLIEVKNLAASAVRAFSAASFVEGEAAPGSLASVFGSGLSGASVVIRDAAGHSEPAPVIYSSPSQLNLLVPAAVSLGRATLTVSRNSGDAQETELNILAVSPGIFTANADGRGVPAARLIRVLSNGERAVEYVFRLDPATSRFLAAPLSVGEPDQETYLELYGTGIRGRSSLGAVSAVLGQTPCEVLAAQGHSLYAGLDQVNLKLPGTLRGRGELTLVLTVDGRASNPVTLAFR